MPRRLTARGCLAAGGKKTGEKYPRCEQELENLLDSPVTGDPEKVPRHASKSVRNVSDALQG
jgi:hypothetical protein